MLETKQFYDDLSSYYHLIFENWDASMARQGDALVGLIEKELGQLTPIDARVLDAACGIGTQTLPLAAQRLFVLLPEISRQKQSPACSRKPILAFDIDAAVADMRGVKDSVSGEFDVVLAFDNSLAHLLGDDDLRTAFREFVAVLRPGGLFLCSVRDYDKVQRGEPATHVYGARQYCGESFQLRQEWSWDDPMHYQATLIVDKETASGVTRELCTVSRFYAISTGRLLELMRESGFRVPSDR